MCKQSHYQGQTQACNFIFSTYEKLGCETGVPLWCHFSKFFSAVWKQYISTKQQQKVLNLESCLFFLRWKIWFFIIFSKIWDFNNPCDVIKLKLSHKWAIFVYSIPTVIKRSNSVTMFFFRLVIPFWDQAFKIMIWPIPNPSFWCHSNIGSKETQICVSNTICENKVIIKVKPKHVILFF